MTTFHDQQPLSRRAAREQEREARQASSGTGYPQFLTPEQEEAARLERRREREGQTATPGSRRAQRAAGSVSDTAPDAPAIEVVPVVEAPVVETPVVEAPAAEPPASYRVRDFSPDGSMTAGATPPPLVEPPAGAPVALDYRTVGLPEMLHPSEAQVLLPTTPPPTTPLAATPLAAAPLTRRELRLRELAETEKAAADTPPAPRSTGFADTIAQFEALRRAQAPAQSVSVDAEPVVEELAVIEPGPADEFVESVPEAFDEPKSEPAAAPWSSMFDATSPPSAPSAADRVDLPPPVFDAVVEAPTDTATPGAWPFEFTQTRPAAHPELDDDVEEDVVVAVVDASAEGQSAAASDEWAPQPTAAEVPDLVPEFAEPQFEEPPFVKPPVVRESYTPPVGHWTRQAELEDDDLPFENTLSREVGGGHSTTTTSALILPSIPVPDFSNIINATGEIMITGTIDLPQGLATMGAESHQLDDSSVDAMFEAADKELVSNDSQPVRAIRAVSTHTSTRGVISVPTKPPSARWLRVAAVSAVVLAVSVVAFLGIYVFTTVL
jgi:hypothetical protein